MLLCVIDPRTPEATANTQDIAAMGVQARGHTLVGGLRVFPHLIQKNITHSNECSLMREYSGENTVDRTRDLQIFSLTRSQLRYVLPNLGSTSVLDAGPFRVFLYHFLNIFLDTIGTRTQS